VETQGWGHGNKFPGHHSEQHPVAGDRWNHPVIAVNYQQLLDSI
jgi:hypothetical protein